MTFLGLHRTPGGHNNCQGDWQCWSRTSWWDLCGSLAATNWAQDIWKNIWKIKETWSIYTYIYYIYIYILYIYIYIIYIIYILYIYYIYIYGPWLSVHSYQSCFCKVDHDLVESSECWWTEVCKCCLTSKSNGFPCSMTGLILVELILFAWWDNILAPLAYRIFECLRIAFRFTYKASMYTYAVWSSFHFNFRTNNWFPCTLTLDESFWCFEALSSFQRWTENSDLTIIFL